MTVISLVSICFGVAMFGTVIGGIMGALHKKSNPGDTAGAVARGMLTGGGAVVGAFGVIAVILVLAGQIEPAQQDGSPTSVQITSTSSAPGNPPAGAAPR